MYSLVAKTIGLCDTKLGNMPKEHAHFRRIWTRHIRSIRRMDMDHPLYSLFGFIQLKRERLSTINGHIIAVIC